MLIANPIYDSVFKFLMQDEEAAKLLISAILEMPVLELEFKPQEYISQIHYAAIYRVDFKAKVQLEDGSTKLVLIELQKIKFASDTFRFRRYIGEQYSSKDNMDGNTGIPIITIYLLGHYLDTAPQIPIIKVKRHYLAHGTNEILNIKDPFIEALTHDSIVIQLPALKAKSQKTELEKILSIFELAKIHKIEIKEEEYPVSHFGILRRLVRAVSDEETRKIMDVEDDVLDEFKMKEETIEEALKRLEREKQRAEQEKQRAEQKEKELEQEKQRVEQKEKELEQEKQRAEQEKQRAEQEKQRAEQEKQRAEQEKQRAEQEKVQTIKQLLSMGLSLENIMKATNTDETFLKKHHLIP